MISHVLPKHRTFQGSSQRTKTLPFADGETKLWGTEVTRQDFQRIEHEAFQLLWTSAQHRSGALLIVYLFVSCKESICQLLAKNSSTLGAECVE